MPDRAPAETTNLDIYGNAPLEWSRVVAAMSGDPSEALTWFLGTVGPDGRPHAAGVTERQRPDRVFHATPHPRPHDCCRRPQPSNSRS